MKQQVTLDSKEIKAIVAKALGLPPALVVQLRYSIAVENMPPEEVEKRIKEFLGADGQR